MSEKRLILAAIILVLLVMAICGVGLYRQQAERACAVDATIVLSDR